MKQLFKYNIIFIFILIFISCKSDSDYNDSIDENISEEIVNNYPDGVYCAEVEYYNPNTGTNSAYTLTVEIEDNQLIKINFPNGGWLDDDYYDAEIDENGYTSFTSTKGYDYTIQIIGEEDGCFTDVAIAEQCQGTTEDGYDCQNMTDNENGFCWMHQEQQYGNYGSSNQDDEENNYDDENEDSEDSEY